MKPGPSAMLAKRRQPNQPSQMTHRPKMRLIGTEAQYF